MKKFLSLLLVLIWAISLSACGDLANPPINNESISDTTDGEKPTTDNEATSDTTDDENPPIEPNPVSDFEYEINSIQTGIWIKKYVGSSEHVVIPSHIENLPVVSLRGVPDENYPSSVDEGVFEGSNVKTVIIPETVLVIGFTCFHDCQSLTSVTFTANSALAFVKGRAFQNCTALEQIDFSSTKLQEIELFAFNGCTKLKEITFSSTLEKIGEKAFYECPSWLEVDFPDSLIEVEGGAFAYCTSIEKVWVPARMNLIALEEAIFYGVPNLKTIEFKEGRESIMGYGLFNTNVNIEMIIPASVKKLSPLPFFFNPPSIVTITFLGNAPEIVEDKDVSWLENAIIYYDPETVGWETFAWKDKCEVKPIPQK